MKVCLDLSKRLSVGQGNKRNEQESGVSEVFLGESHFLSLQTLECPLPHLPDEVVTQAPRVKFEVAR